jgi:hypothetical protein
MEGFTQTLSVCLGPSSTEGLRQGVFSLGPVQLCICV